VHSKVIYKIMKYGFLFLFSIMLLIASSGISFNKMICSSGHISYSFIKFDNCVDFDFAAETSISEKCCDFFVHFIKIENLINGINIFMFLMLFLNFIFKVNILFFFKKHTNKTIKIIWPPPTYHKLFLLKNSSPFLSCLVI
jgi:hypothetical protein